MFSKTLDKKNRPRVLLALCIHIDSYLAYICAERDLPMLYDIVLKPH